LTTGANKKGRGGGPLELMWVSDAAT